MKQIIVVKPNSISVEQKEFLKENNCIVIEHNNPNEVRIISLTEGFDADDLFNTMVETIQKSAYTTKQDFTDRFLSKIQNNVKGKSEK